MMLSMRNKLDGICIHIDDDVYNLRSQYGLYKIEIIFFKVKQDRRIKGKNYPIYKIITCPIRANILDVYSKLEKWFFVLANPKEICVKEWYLCKEHFVIRSVKCKL